MRSYTSEVHRPLETGLSFQPSYESISGDWAWKVRSYNVCFVCFNRYAFSVRSSIIFVRPKLSDNSTLYNCIILFRRISFGRKFNTVVRSGYGGRLWYEVKLYTFNTRILLLRFKYLICGQNFKTLYPLFSELRLNN